MSKRILIVEDEKNLARFVSLELQHEGYDVVTADNGREGLEMALEKDFDLILLDLMLPEMDGFEVTRRLQQEKDTYIMMMTARDSIMDIVAGLDRGADDYIVKPFVKEVLLARVEMHLERSAKETGKSFADAAIEKNRGEIQKKLTPIEWKIALAVAQGMENREIAEQMNYSYGYVKNVIARIFSKLEIERRRELRKLLIG